MEEAQATVTAPCALILAQTSAENQETVDAWFRRDFESTNLEPKGIVSGASKGCACNWTAQIACGLPVHVTIDAMCDSDVMCTQFLRLFSAPAASIVVQAGLVRPSKSKLHSVKLS